MEQNPSVFDSGDLPSNPNTPGFCCPQSNRLKHPEVLLHTKHSGVRLRAEPTPQTPGGFTSHQEVEMKKEYLQKKEKGKNRFLAIECRSHSGIEQEFVSGGELLAGRQQWQGTFY